jgi:hypothetical protein
VDVSGDVGPSRPISAGAATNLATARGPLERACRDAGLPVEVSTLMHLEELARKAFGIVGRDVTPAEFRRAARLHRKIAENWRRIAAPKEGLSVRQAKRQLMAEHGLTSGRQWKHWKREQQRAMRAELRASEG